jgi:hypothetical protein
MPNHWDKLKKRLEPFNTIIGVAFVGALLIAFVIGLRLFGDAFRSNALPFALLWIAAPIFAYFLKRQSLSSWFTLTGMRRVQVVLMTVVIAISFTMFFGDYIVRNQIGGRFVEGYRSWTHRPSEEELEYDPYAPFPTYAGDDWMVEKNPAGEWGLQAFQLLLMVLAFALPVITWKASEAAVERMEQAEWNRKLAEHKAGSDKEEEEEEEDDDDDDDDD